MGNLGQPRWSPPPSSWVKINVDAAARNFFVVTTLVVRDNKGRILAPSTMKWNCTLALAVEVLAILTAIKLAISKG